ncbi:hypothetical protein L6452_32873 [Arctium lappa]|uniref:Uncharacterized protein n=1 Tax=Arctium lappa TaxID=4217 RepID=A0ACB8Z6Y0_ARCLA|nr:hypothetical protein L6452_32873 [Arctium lappa]
MALNTTPSVTELDYDRQAEFKAFDETKAGVKGLVDAGITEIVNHGIPSSVLEEMIEGVRGFHEQDTEVKKQWYNMSFREKPPVVFHSNFYNAPVPGWRDTLICHMAPNPPNHHEMPPICREILMKYSDEVQKLSVRILELFSEALGLNPSHLVEMGYAEGLSMLGIYYPPCPQPELTIGSQKHTDSTLFTILLQDHIGGLQLLTNGKFECASHRVLSKKVGPRISVASFLRVPSTQSYKVIEPIKELLSEENPAKYRSTTMEEFTKYSMAKGLNGVPTTLHYQI